MAVGETYDISISFSPTDSVSEGAYTFYLRVTSTNYPTTDINLYVSVTQSGIGNALFKVSDIYTGTIDENSQIIQGLNGAKVKVQNEEVLTIEETMNTDSLGEAYFEDLPAGKYKCRITANNHQEYIGRFWVKPGITVNEEIFLDYNLVTVEWEVTETTIEDTYEIVLTATYETDVPAAVVVAEPAAVSLPAMSAGDVYNGEFTLTNYGLIRADNIAFTLPQGDQYFSYELLGGLPTSIDAKDRIAVPYRVTCLTSPDQGDGDGTGGGCVRYGICVTIGYGYTCTNGVLTTNSTTYCLIYDNGQCEGSSGGGGVPGSGGGGGTWNMGGGTGPGSVPTPAPSSKQIDGVICFPATVRKECYCDACARLKETRKNTIVNTLSSVNTVLREYSRDHEDLSIKVPGGAMSVKRWYYDNQWHWERNRNNLSFKWDSLGQYIESIDKGGVIYKRTSSISQVYTHHTYKIVPKDSGYRWEDKRGNWKEYDENGRMTSYGRRSGVIGNLLYEQGENGKLIGITDKNDNQVIWYEYDGDGRISAVHDSENRRVEYTFTNGLLTKVTDVLGNDTTYEYDGNGRITKTLDPLGRESHVTKMSTTAWHRFWTVKGTAISLSLIMMRVRKNNMSVSPHHWV